MRPQQASENGLPDAEPEIVRGVPEGEEVAEAEGEGGESSEEEEEAALEVEEPARVLEWVAALNALRKSRQYYDVVLVCGGTEVAAHRAVLAAACPHLLPPGGDCFRVDAEPDAVRALLDYLYTGRLRVAGGGAALALYRAAWRLRVDAVCARAAELLARRLRPDAGCLRARALPDLPPPLRARLDRYIADHFRELCAAGALASLPTLRLRLRDPGHAFAPPAPADTAAAALHYLRRLLRDGLALEAACARPHLVYRDEEGALRDCELLPARDDDPPDLVAYRRERRERAPPPPSPAPPASPAPTPLASLVVGERAPSARWALLAAEAVAERAVEALAEAGCALVRLSVCARAVVRREAEGAGGELGRLAGGRCAHGLAALGGRLLACGGYDRAEVLRSVESYSAATNAWTALPEMRAPRARFTLAKCGDSLYAVAGSDGHNDLDTLEEYREVNGVGTWVLRARLPAAVSQSAVCAVEADGDEGALLVVAGGGGGGEAAARVSVYSARDDRWRRGPSLRTGRAAACAARWGGAVWVLGGCDTWHCLASTERLSVCGGGAGGDRLAGSWEEGPALGGARRSAAAVAWRGALLVLGGSDGAASLRRVEVLSCGGEGEAWRRGPAMREARAALQAAALGDGGPLLVVGGYSGHDFLPTMECLMALDGEWSTLRDPSQGPMSPLATKTTPAPAPAPTVPTDKDQQERGDESAKQ